MEYNSPSVGRVERPPVAARSSDFGDALRLQRQSRPRTQSWTIWPVSSCPGRRSPIGAITHDHGSGFDIHVLQGARDKSCALLQSDEARQSAKDPNRRPPTAGLCRRCSRVAPFDGGLDWCTTCPRRNAVMIRSALLPRCPEAYGGSLMAKFPLGDFRRFIGTRYERWILPVLPAGAVLKPRQDGTTIDPAISARSPANSSSATAPG